MRVRMTKTAAGPADVHYAGRIYNLTDEIAQAYIAAEAAEALDSPAPQVADATPRETADAPPKRRSRRRST